MTMMQGGHCSVATRDGGESLSREKRFLTPFHEWKKVPDTFSCAEVGL